MILQDVESRYGHEALAEESRTLLAHEITHAPDGLLIPRARAHSWIWESKKPGKDSRTQKIVSRAIDETEETVVRGVFNTNIDLPEPHTLPSDIIITFPGQYRYLYLTPGLYLEGNLNPNHDPYEILNLSHPCFLLTRTINKLISRGEMISKLEELDEFITQRFLNAPKLNYYPHAWSPFETGPTS